MNNPILRVVLAASLGLGLHFFAEAQVTCPAKENVVSWWGNESIQNDVNPKITLDFMKRYNLGIVESVIPVVNPGKVGNALSFSASGAGTCLYSLQPIVELNGGSSGLDNLAGCTIEGWIYPTELPSGDDIAIIFANSTGATGNIQKWLFLNSNGFLVFQIYTDMDEWYSDSSSSHIELNNWNHFAVVCGGGSDAGGMKIYVNGSNEDQSNNLYIGVGKGPTGANTFSIGNWKEYQDAPYVQYFDFFGVIKTANKIGFNGMIDEMTIYKCRLSDNEIKSIYDSDTKGKIKSDIWISDGKTDIGTVPVEVPFWTSDEIWIDNDADFKKDRPAYWDGEEEDEAPINKVYAVIHNLGPVDATNVDVNFYYRHCSTGISFPGNDNSAVLINVGGPIEVNTIPARGNSVIGPIDMMLPEEPTETAQDHYCLGVVADCDADHPKVPNVTSNLDNNIGMVNLPYLNSQVVYHGATVDAEYQCYVQAGTAGAQGQGQQTSSMQMNATNSSSYSLEINSNLPMAWTVERKAGLWPAIPFWPFRRWNSVGNKAIDFKLTQKSTKGFNFRIKAPKEDNQSHNRYEIIIQQRDKASEKIIGGCTYKINEDYLPPEQIKIISVNLKNGKPILSWEPVLYEIKSRNPESIWYYDIIRNGKHIAKVLRDSDPQIAEWQWQDNHATKGVQKYSIVAVDEGGNRSDKSKEVEVNIIP